MISASAIILAEPQLGAPPAQADDPQMVRLWLARTSSPNTRRNYEREARLFLAHVGKPLGLVRMGELQDYITGLPGSSAAVALAASALMSLFTFALEVGFLRSNIGSPVKVPPIKSTLAERIMSEADAMLLIRQEPALRNRVLLTVLYGGGLRISEVCGLRWRDLANRDEAGQATVFGKGGKIRAVLLSASTWRVLTALRGEAPADAPVPVSEGRGARPGRGPPAGEGGCGARRARAGGLGSLAAAGSRLASTAGRRCTSCKPRSGTLRLRPPGAICRRGYPRTRLGS